MQTAQLIEDLEKGLAAAKELAAYVPSRSPETTRAPETAPGTRDEDAQMPGGVDSAPVSEDAPTRTIASEVEEEGVEILHELKEGTPVKALAHALGGASGAVESIVQAISDLAQGVRI